MRRRDHDYWKNPGLILLQFRDGQATDMQTLLQALDATNVSLAVRRHITEIVRKQIEIGLLEAEDSKDLEHAKINVTKLLPEFQAALDISLTFLASFNSGRSMVVQPLFGPPSEREKLDVFVLMPFKEDLHPVYEDHIKTSCTNLGLTVWRADDFFTTRSVVEDIWTAIASARLIVGDCTDRNPNVFYEIGLALAIGQPTILITQRAEDVPFDLRHLRYITYQLTPREMNEFERTFKEAVQRTLAMK
jgi:hypothetical protein